VTTCPGQAGQNRGLSHGTAHETVDVGLPRDGGLAAAPAAAGPAALGHSSQHPKVLWLAQP
jgi:hypothetical protein